jgi:hypothetical protein
MRWLAAWAMMLLVGVPALWAQNDEKDKPKEPAKSKVTEEVDAVIMAHQKAVSDFYKNNDELLKNAKTAKERSKIFEAFPKAAVAIERLQDLLEKNPQEKDAAVTASQWILNNSYGGDENEKTRARTLDFLITNHADNPKIAITLGGLSNMPSAKAEEFLRAVLAKNPAKDAQGKANLYLGSYLKSVAEMVKNIKETPEEAKRLESFLGKETFAKLKEADADKIAKEAVAVFEQAAAKYGDVVLFTNPKTKKNTTIADRASGELFEIRNLSIGKPVPDIEGEDLDGKPFKLSDYRGKVVVIDFWGNW